MKQLAAKLTAYEVILSKTKYLAGDVRFFLTPLRIALINFRIYKIRSHDLFHLPYGSKLKMGRSEVMSDPSRPNVARCDLCSPLPAIQD
jgi:hypothetical protein